MAGAVGTVAGDIPTVLPDIDTVRLYFTANDSKEYNNLLVRLGDKLFPTYERILADKDATADELSGVFGVLCAVKADRSRFLEHAVAGLARWNISIRRNALALLARIGTARDQAPVVALLSDKEWTLAVAAAQTLAAIGDRRALAAMDVWLNSSTPRGDRNERFNETFRQDIAKYRDQLKARLEKEEKEKPPGK